MTEGQGKMDKGEELVCQVNCIHEEILNAIRPEMDKLEGVADIFKALSDETRVKVIFALGEAELCVCDVAELIDGSVATASYHLRLLRNLGLARYRKEGKMVYYQLTSPHYANLINEVVLHLKKNK